MCVLHFKEPTKRWIQMSEIEKRSDPKIEKRQSLFTVEPAVRLLAYTCGSCLRPPLAGSLAPRNPPVRSLRPTSAGLNPIITININNVMNTNMNSNMSTEIIIIGLLQAQRPGLGRDAALGPLQPGEPQGQGHGDPFATGASEEASRRAAGASETEAWD